MVFFGDEPAGGEEEGTGKSQPGAEFAFAGPGFVGLGDEIVVVDGVVSEEDPVLGHPKADEVFAMRRPAGESAGEVSQEKAFDPFPGSVARVIPKGGFGHDDGRYFQIRTGAQCRQRRGKPPTVDDKQIGIALAEDSSKQRLEGSRRQGFGVAIPQEGVAVEGQRIGGSVPGISIIVRTPLEGRQSGKGFMRGLEPRPMVGAEAVKADKKMGWLVLHGLEANSFGYTNLPKKKRARVGRMAVVNQNMLRMQMIPPKKPVA